MRFQRFKNYSVFGVETLFAAILSAVRLTYRTIIRRFCDAKIACIFIVPLNHEINISVHQIKHRFETNYCRHLFMPSHKGKIKTIQQKRPTFFTIYLSESRICAVVCALVTGGSILYEDQSVSSIWERPFCALCKVTNMALDLKFASAYEAMSSITCITNHSLMEIYSSNILKC